MSQCNNTFTECSAKCNNKAMTTIKSAAGYIANCRYCVSVCVCVCDRCGGGASQYDTVSPLVSSSSRTTLLMSLSSDSS